MHRVHECFLEKIIHLIFSNFWKRYVTYQFCVLDLLTKYYIIFWILLFFCSPPKVSLYSLDLYIILGFTLFHPRSFSEISTKARAFSPLPGLSPFVEDRENEFEILSGTLRFNAQPRALIHDRRNNDDDRRGSREVTGRRKITINPSTGGGRADEARVYQSPRVFRVHPVE